MSNEIVGAQYVYVTIPKSDVKLYHRLMSLMADYGEAKLKDCTAECLRNNQLVINAYNMFNAAIAAKNRDETSLYNTLIKYVEATIDNLYKGQSSDNLDDIGFIYDSDIDGNVLIDIENRLLVTHDNNVDTIWSIVPYAAPREIKNIYYRINITSFQYGKAEASANVSYLNKPSSTPSYTHTKVIEYWDGGENTEITENSNVNIRYEVVSGNIAVDSVTGKITLPAYTGGTEQTVGQVKVIISTATPEQGYEGVSENRDTAIIQKAYKDYTLLQACIPLTTSQVSNIVSGSLDLSSLITPTAIQNNRYLIYDYQGNSTTTYILDNNNKDNVEDELDLQTSSNTYYVQVFLLSTKTHKVINYSKALGQESKSPIEDQRFRSDINYTKYEDNNYTYNDKSYKLLAIVRKNPINTKILIQQQNG